MDSKLGVAASAMITRLPTRATSAPTITARGVPHRRANRGASKPAPKTINTVAAKYRASCNPVSPNSLIRMAGAVAKKVKSMPIVRLTDSAGKMKRRSAASAT